MDKMRTKVDRRHEINAIHEEVKKLRDELSGVEASKLKMREDFRRE